MEECIKAFAKCEEQGKSVEMVWFDNNVFFDGFAQFYDITCCAEVYHYPTQCTFSPKQWLDNLIRLNHQSFTASWNMLIDFSFLKSLKLYFLNGVIYEDASFGVMLFMSANRICFTPKKLHYYRVRPNSTTFQSVTSIAPYLLPFYNVFFKDIIAAKEYHGNSSRMRLFLQLLEFFNAFGDKEFAELAKKTFLPCLAQGSLKILNSAKDPLNLLPKLDLTKPYITASRLSLFVRLYFSYPKARSFLLFFKRAYEIQRIFERKIRRKIFKKYKQR
ncbi:hypothetical protein CQA49_05735 [Helicobacter sp. MIT 00-7814]|uniref:hypothetical protein n=1 Tax=unclassified Helicobacter TaxID=2593540 RepID=UPI000E1F7D9D|nr:MULTISPECIES: hypothetical protein [unclassified Helicobacter]RDU53722.1 hypothetical protein CQA37_06880 [Helicobacter sp. MIT 99-10781]RDU54108.1 hypothetical protein CQA49_05735 [Helicobacter sp. MIT 00-7814]